MTVSNANSIEPTNVEKLKGLPWSISRDVTLSVFAQFVFFGSGFVLFLSEIGLTKTQIGLLKSMVPFLGIIALFIAPKVAQIGYKRTYLISWGIRYVVSGLLLLTPWVIMRFGGAYVLLYVGAIQVVFATSRAIGVTALLPWEHEFIPNTIRGRYYATSNLLSNLTGFIAVLAAGYVIDRAVGLNGYMLLFGVGTVFGFISLWMAGFIPGGAPVSEGELPSGRIAAGGMTALRDRSFVRYLVGAGLLALAAGPLSSFLPLFMQEQVGLSTGYTILLQTGTLLGGLVSSYLWGWASDRYGSRPVMLSGVIFTAVLPLFWMFIPRGSDWSLPAAIGISFLQGVINLGWLIGSSRTLYVSVVPPEKKTIYMALYSTWMGLMGGISHLVGGRLLDFTSSLGLDGYFWIFPIDSYTVLFVAGIIFPLLGLVLLWKVRADTTVSMGEFAGLLLHGNPFLAVESLVRYQFAKDERAVVTATEHLGQAKSPLTVEELLDALEDPRFYVRFEAIVAIARHGPDERLMEALIRILNGNEPALSVIAAWALGRIGDERALDPLRAALDAPYRSVQIHAARSLGSLEDPKYAPLLLDRLKVEKDIGLRLAYISVLGKLGIKEAAPDMLELLRSHPDQDTHKEISFALARLVGDEARFIQLLRDSRQDPATALSQSLLAFQKKINEMQIADNSFDQQIDPCAEALARGDINGGIAMLVELIENLPTEIYSDLGRMILADLLVEMKKPSDAQLDFVMLALHTLQEG